MKRNPSRRAFLAAATTGTAALAGCGALSGSDDSTNTRTTSVLTDTEASGNGNGQTTTSPKGTPTGTSTPSPQRDYTKRGEVLDDFEDLDLWGTILGEATAETKNAFKGKQSVRIQNPAGDGAGIYKSFPDGLDLTKHDLSIAAKIEKPASAKLAMEVIAPARSDHLVCRRYVPKKMNGWMRMDMGYTGLRGNPDLSNVQELRIIVLSDGKPINYVIDDLRMVPKSTKKGRVIVNFDDTKASQYDIGFKEMKKRGFPAMVGAIPDEINASGSLTTGQLRTMRSEGWDIISNPQTGTPLPELSEDEQRRLIKDTKEYLRLKGFREGMQFMSIPYGRFNSTTLDLVDEFHEYGFAFGACPNIIPPVGKSAVSTVSGSDLNGAARMINLAAKYNQLTVVTFNGIGKNKDVTKKHFTHLLDIMKNWERKGKLKVTTPSEILKLQES